MSTTLLTLQNLSLHYPHKVIFKDVTFTLNQGDKIGVLGLNGHGKSSLFKVIAGLVTPDTTVPPFIYDKSRDFSFFYVPQELSNLEAWTVENYFFEFHPKMGALKRRLDEVNDKLGTGDGDFDKLIHEQERILLVQSARIIISIFVYSFSLGNSRNKNLPILLLCPPTRK
jgi:ATPase subunit of ABC transporter with duplicated ATPase domains